MILTDAQITKAIEKAGIAFPNFRNWQYNNEKNREYLGFSLWGEYVLKTENRLSRTFFITLDTHQNQWRGYLTIGQHSYLWSSTEIGEAHLLCIHNCDSIDEVISQLKAEILKLFNAFS